MNQWLVLYCLIFNPEKRNDIISKVIPNYFSDDIALRLYEYVTELNDKNVQVDLTLIKSKFNQKEFEIISNWLSDKFLGQVNLDNYEEYIANLRAEFVTREIKQFGLLISKQDQINEDKFLDFNDKLINNITLTKKTNLLSSNELVDYFLAKVDQEKEGIDGLSTGIETLDEILDGLKPEDYILLAGRPSMGKSGLMGWIAMVNALKNIPVLIISLEMSGPSLIGRMFCAASRIEAWKFKKKSFRNTEENKRFNDYVERFKTMPLVIDSTPNLDIQSMRAIIQRVKLQYPNLGLVCVDYIQKMSGHGDNQNNIVSNISKQIKGIAKMYQVPILVCAQLSRLCESRENKRPELSDLRDSGALEQDADIIAMLYRDHYYSRNPEHKNICEILVRKFRNGETGKVVVDYDLSTQAFKSIKPNTKLFELAKRFYYE